MKKTYNFLILVLTVAFLAGCKKGDDTYYNFEPVTINYKGTALDYLKTQPGVFDSLMLVVNRFPALSDSLKVSNLTIFGVTNKSFEYAVKGLNRERAFQKKTPLYLSSIDGPTLDTIIYRYILKTPLTSDYVKTQSNGVNQSAMKYAYDMHVQYGNLNASGLVGNGEQQLIFSDMNNSAVASNWVNANTAVINVKTQNAIIHVLNTDHVFGFNQFLLKFNK
ncbi:hypothetical protein CA265_02500 [Sphingobacteriaceae bacterium GW460-11-11-14-LB5]|nr:hypothetical protein CA265_02500 [Sphingobacteriaceae bacterium GW460-11-11-14-LB5]